MKQIELHKKIDDILQKNPDSLKKKDVFIYIIIGLTLLQMDTDNTYIKS